MSDRKNIPEEGSKVIDFTLHDQDNTLVKLSDFKGKWVILYFYPKDNTSGCTREAVDFTTHLDEISSLGGVVIGISPDSVECHRKFREKHDLKVSLLSDPSHEVIENYGAWQLKKNYGREYYGVVRSTFLINPEGKIVKVWPKVRVDGHVEDVLKNLKALKEGN